MRKTTTMIVLNDFQTTVRKALSEIDPNWESYDGLVVCGTHAPHDTEEMIEEIRKARENNTPTLLVCAGHQLGAIEYARNVLGIEDATSEEFNVKGTIVVHKLPQLKVGLHNGETYWNNYEINEDILKLWKKDDNFITCQYHPEYQSSREKPHPLLVKFLQSCKK